MQREMLSCYDADGRAQPIDGPVPLGARTPQPRPCFTPSASPPSPSPAPSRIHPNDLPSPRRRASHLSLSSYPPPSLSLSAGSPSGSMSCFLHLLSVFCPSPRLSFVRESRLDIALCIPYLSLTPLLAGVSVAILTLVLCIRRLRSLFRFQPYRSSL